MIDWSTCQAVEQVPGKVSGAWVFTNTRVPLAHLFANLEAGATIEGWDEPTRVRNLQRVVNNSRFLVLPWVRVQNLASRLLALLAKRLAVDWGDHRRRTPQAEDPGNKSRAE